ncbi:TIGR03790 family protein [Haloferula sp. A504]|uniref:TIGR03790 family protein n=1 Tax=Haloferula sp. A504 TaxID=3373601 RepID=UPI0031BDB7BF|nr:TIGR03790 family protein [Verrucomicrobiaceae bacterium E54]
MFPVPLLILVLSVALRAEPPEPPRPATVAVIYNSGVEGSEKLARLYAEKRDIPAENLIGLPLPDKEEISRDEYDSLLREPLAGIFDERRWWRRVRDPKGNPALQSTKIRILVCMRGVPSRIKHAFPKNENGAPPTQQQMMATASAAVDSELAMLENEGLPLEGPLNNPYFKSDAPVAEAEPPILLVGRIDAHSFAVCERMIEDAVEVEKTGLWGFAVVDLANKIAQGDGWMRTAATTLDGQGIPTLVDRFNETLPVNFPLDDTAYYLGWYDWNVSGPFVKPGFKFKRGAVAVHLHSFSAATLRDPNKTWCAPLLARGAAATVGNVYEPFLHLTHHLDILTDRLLDGHTLVEAAYMAAPAVSWQAVVLGDPLYRPFVRIDGSGRKADADRLFRALRIAQLRWPSDDTEREAQLRAASTRMNDPRLLEAVGLHLHLIGRGDRAASIFRDALPRFTDPAGKLRMDLHIARIDREAGRKEAAIRQLRTASTTFASLPEAKAALAWLNIIDPPPPPPAQAPENR